MRRRLRRPRSNCGATNRQPHARLCVGSPQGCGGITRRGSPRGLGQVWAHPRVHRSAPRAFRPRGIESQGTGQDTQGHQEFSPQAVSQVIPHGRGPSSFHP